MTPFEQAIVSAIEPVRSERFGQSLRRFHPNLRATRSSRMDDLANFEMGLGGPIGRTLGLVDIMRLTNTPHIRLTEDDRNYLLWVVSVHQYLQALTARWWQPISANVYAAFFDRDDAPQFAINYISGLRVLRCPSLIRSARLIGVERHGARAMQSLIDAAHTTNSWRDAHAAAERISADPTYCRRLLERRTRLGQELAPESGLTVEQVERRAMERIPQVLESSGEDERSLRRYNRLVQAGIASVLGWVERFADLEPITRLDEPAYVELDDGVELVHFTARVDYALLKKWTPFEVRTGEPLDGLYLCEGFLYQFGADVMTDVHGSSLRSMAGSGEDD